MKERDREIRPAETVEKRGSAQARLTKTQIEESLNRAAAGAEELDKKLKSVFELPEPNTFLRITQ